MAELVTRAFEDEQGLEVVSGLVHDAVFRESSIRFDPEQQKFSVQLWREVPEVERRTRVMVVFSKIEYLRAASVLTVLDVESAEVRVRDKLDYYSLFRLQYCSKSRILRFETEGTIEITLHVSRLRGMLADTGETTWEQFGYCTSGMFPWV